jgi:hypothetical protein
MPVDNRRDQFEHANFAPSPSAGQECAKVPDIARIVHHEGLCHQIINVGCKEDYGALLLHRVIKRGQKAPEVPNRI